MAPRQHEQLAQEQHITEAIGETGPRQRIGRLHVFVPAGIIDARMLAAGEEKFLSGHAQGFLDGGEQHMTPGGDGCFRHKKAVVFPRVAADESAGGIVAETIGFQPLPAQNPAQILAGAFVKMKAHTHSPLAMPPCGVPPGGGRCVYGGCRGVRNGFSLCFV